MKAPLRSSSLMFLSLVAAASLGCHSAYVEADVTNSTGGPITLLEVDYPSASFGKEALADGTTFHYRFKILGNGGTKVIWTDADRKEHTVTGPDLQEGEEGHLAVTLTGTGASWGKQLHKAH
jgi:hypothetical protein